jgi:GT2 family glycosyltransferase
MADVDVSILICVHNRCDLTRPCLESLWATVPSSIRFEVLIYDDHSTDETAAYLASLGQRIRVMRRPERGHFARNNNRLATEARGRWLCLLNNDTILRPEWLTSMRSLGEATPRAGVIGNFHRFPQNGRINHAGMVFDRDLIPRHLYVGMPDNLACTHRNRRFQILCAACWLVPRARFLELGGFDEAYRNGGEDLDFCLKAAAAGYECWYCGNSRIDHYGQSSLGRLANEEANLNRFLSRWSAGISPDLEQITAEDGVAWPPRSVSYRIARHLWRLDVAEPLRHWVNQSRIGVRLRQQLTGLLSRG